MAHGVREILGPARSPNGVKQGGVRKSVGVMGSRRIFTPAFKLKVLDSYRQDMDCRGNQRATARKYGIHRRQIQKWLQIEPNLMKTIGSPVNRPLASPSPDFKKQSRNQALLQSATLNPTRARLHGDESQSQQSQQQQQQQQQPPPPLQQPQQSQQSQQQSSATTASAVTSYGYMPPQQQQQQQQQHYDYPQPQLIYQPTVQATSTVPSFQFAGFQPPIVHYTPAEQTNLVIKREPALTPDTYHHQQQQHHQSLLPHHHHHHHHTHLLKKERTDDEVCNASSYSSCLSDRLSEVSISPMPSHMESLPLSPRDSTTGCSGSDSEELDSNASTSGFCSPVAENTGSNASKLKRRRSFSLHFKISVLDAFYKHDDCKRNQRATARKFNVNRRQVQKWLVQESELRLLQQNRGNNRQRLGSSSPAATVQQVKREQLRSPTVSSQTSPPPAQLPSSSSIPTTTTMVMMMNVDESPVDLRTSGAIVDYGYGAQMSPNSYVDSALTPPYSQPGCTLSCCSQEQQTRPNYYCYSPPQQQQQQQQQQLSCSMMQEQPLCLVKPKVEPVTSTSQSTPATPTPTKKDAILFKPYLDNPVSKPAPTSPNTNNNNNNSHDTWNLNYGSGSHYLQQSHQLEVQRAASAFLKYPTYLQ